MSAGSPVVPISFLCIASILRETPGSGDSAVTGANYDPNKQSSQMAPEQTKRFNDICELDSQIA